MSGTLVPNEVVWDVLEHEYGRLRNGAKLLAKAAGGVSPRTSENWLARRASPQLESLIPLMANCDALKLAVDRLIEVERQCDP